MITQLIAQLAQVPKQLAQVPKQLALVLELLPLPLVQESQPQLLMQLALVPQLLRYRLSYQALHPPQQSHLQQ